MPCRWLSRLTHPPAPDTSASVPLSALSEPNGNDASSGPYAYRSPRVRARLAIAAVTAGAAGWILFLGLDIGGGVFPGALASIPAVNVSLNVVFVIGYLSILVNLIAVPAALGAWAHRCFANHWALASSDSRLSPGWSACGWFIPVVNLVVPYLVVQQTWSGSPPEQRPGTVVKAWWAAWTGNTLLFWLTFATAHRSFQIWIEIAELAALVAAAFLTIIVLHHLTDSQMAKHVELARSGARTSIPTPRIGGWVREWVTAGTRARWAIAAVTFALIGCALMLGTNLLFLVLTGASLTTAPFPVLVLWLSGFSILALGLLVAGPISVAMWMHRAYSNLPALDVHGLVWSPAWAAGSWFVPIANVVVPGLIVRELQRSVAADDPQRRLPVVLWLTAFALGSLLGPLTLLLGSNADLPSVLEDALQMISELLLLAAGVIFILLIRQITSGQAARAAGLKRRE